MASDTVYVVHTLLCIRMYIQPCIQLCMYSYYSVILTILYFVYFNQLINLPYNNTMLYIHIDQYILIHIHTHYSYKLSIGKCTAPDIYT